MNKRTANINNSNDNIDDYVLEYERNFTQDNNIMNSSHVITPTPGFSYAAMARKPKPPPESVQINIGDKIHDVKFEHWHMIKYIGLNKFYCMICRFGNEKGATGDHCKSEMHLQNLQKCVVVDVGKDFFIREAHQEMYHCGHCNNMQQKIDLEAHLQKYDLKRTKNNTYTNVENTFYEKCSLQKIVAKENKDSEIPIQLNTNIVLDSIKILSTGNHDTMSNSTKEAEKRECLNKSIDSVKQLSTKYSTSGNKHVKKGKCLNKSVNNKIALENKISHNATLKMVQIKNNNDKNAPRKIDVSGNEDNMNISSNKNKQKTPFFYRIENSNINVEKKELRITETQIDDERINKALNITNSEVSILDNSINTLENSKETQNRKEKNYCLKIDNNQDAESSKTCSSKSNQISDVVSEYKTKETKPNSTKSHTLESHSFNYSETQISNPLKNNANKSKDSTKNKNTVILCNKTIKKTLPDNKPDECSLDLKKEDKPISHKSKQYKADSTDKKAEMNVSIKNYINSCRSNKTLDHVLSIIECEKNNGDLESNINILSKKLTEANKKYEGHEVESIPKKSKISLNINENLDRELSSENSNNDEFLSGCEDDSINAHFEKVKFNLQSYINLLINKVDELINNKGDEARNNNSKFIIEIHKFNAEIDKAKHKLIESLNKRNKMKNVQETKYFVNNTTQNIDYVLSGIENANIDDKSRERETNNINTDFEEIQKTVVESLMQIKMKLLCTNNSNTDSVQTSKVNLSLLKEKVIINCDQEAKEVNKVSKKRKTQNTSLKNQKLRVGDLNIYISNNNENSKNIVQTNETKIGAKIVDQIATKVSKTITNNKYYINSLIEFSRIKQYNTYFIYFVSQMAVDVNEFGHKLIITYMSLNTIRETRINFNCAACAMILNDGQLIEHLISTEHLEKVKLYPFSSAYSINLIRQIGRYFHCGICNILMSPKLILMHNSTSEHRSLLRKAIMVDNAEAQKTNNSYTDNQPVASTSQDTNNISTIETSREKAKEILNTNMLAENILPKTRNGTAANNTSNDKLINSETIFKDLKSSENDKVFHVYILANLCDVYIKLQIEAWNTLVVTVNNDLFCFVCDEFAFFERNLSEKLSSGKEFYYKKLREHTDSNDHLEQLNIYKILSNFNTNMIRQRLENCHCAICNIACSKDAIITHLSSPTHVENHNNSIFLDKKLLDNTANTYHEIEVLTQKMKPNEASRGNDDDNNKDLNVMASTSLQLFTEKDLDDAGDNEYNSDSDEVVFRVVIPDNNWHGIVSTPNGYKCILCNVNIKKKQYERHIYHEKHDNNVDNRTFAEYRDDLIRQLDEKRMHCVLCNVELAPIDVATHIQGKKHKDNKKTILNK